ncbi:MAG: sigma-70 family RNA polymerase sigma factor [Planctomycetota bacterium]
MTHATLAEQRTISPPHGNAIIDAIELDDRGLVVRAQAGDAHAFGLLLRRYERRLLAVARRAAGGEAEPEDVVQDAALKAWTAIGRFDPDRPLAPWLFTVTVRVARTHRGRHRRRRLLLLRAPQPANRDATGPAPTEDSIWSVVDACLPPQQRIALWLRYGERLDAPAIAAALDTNATAVRAVLARARRSLRRHLEQQGAIDDGREPHDA